MDLPVLGIDVGKFELASMLSNHGGGATGPLAEMPNQCLKSGKEREMERGSVRVCLVLLCASVSSLAGCSAGVSQIKLLSQGATGISSSSTSKGIMVSSRRRAFTSATISKDGRRSSWMLPEALNEDLLYISNVTTVTVYSYPRGRHVGTLKGFYEAAGECVDRAGNVYIATGDTEVEYSHGGTKRIKTLTFPGYVAVDCSVDPITGNLAVTWNQSASSTNYIAIYPNASGTPTLYGLDGRFVFYCGYDNSGNLFVDGQVGFGSQNVIFVELPNGANRLKKIMLNQSFQHAGAVQWDGTYVAVGDDVAQKIYRFAISGSAGTLEGTVNLGNAQYVYQWWIQGKKVIGPDGTQNTVWYWHYPAGGSPTKSIRKDIEAPYGATVSKGPG